jgi:hypothetical protein
MKQEKEVKYGDNFNKKEGTFLYDNKRDEMLLNVLDLYPDKTTFFFKGVKGNQKKKELQDKVRSVFDQTVTEIEEYENAGGRGRRRLRDALRKVGRGIATAGLAPARGAALGLIRLNFRASAKKFNLLTAEAKEKLEKKWEKLGGNVDKLNAAINAGKGKKPFVCGKKCRAEAGKNPQLPSEATSDFVNFSDPVTAALIGAGGGVVAGLLKLVDTKKNFKNQKALMEYNAELNQAQSQEDAVDATMTPQERKIAEEVIKAQESGFDPIEAIRRNPNLTADEKAAAIAEINEAQGGDDDKRKKIIIAVGVVALLVGGYYIYKLTSKKSE